MSYDEKCPVCGTINHGVNLDETEGWMICEHCGKETQDYRFIKRAKIPVVSSKAAAKYAVPFDLRASK